MKNSPRSTVPGQSQTVSDYLSHKSFLVMSSEDIIFIMFYYLSLEFKEELTIFRHASVSCTCPCKLVGPLVRWSHFRISNLWSPFCATVVFDDPTAMLLVYPPSPSFFQNFDDISKYI